MAVHDIVIVGASFAGMGTAHYILRHTIPKLKASNDGQTYKVTLISTTDQFFYKIGAPRTVASPDLLPVSKLLIPLADGFKDYPANHFELVIGTASAVDEDKRTVTVKRKDGATTAVSYNSLVCATGSKSKSPLWTLHDDPQQSIDEFKLFHERIPKADSILVVGGGPAGVETAGELAAQYPGKEIAIVSGNTQLLRRLMTSDGQPNATGAKVGKNAESYLTNMGVTTINNNKVSSTAQEGSKTLVTFDNGAEPMSVDIYIDATGGVRNASWLPTHWLTPENQVLVDATTLRSSTPNTERVYAIGDIASYSQLAVLDINDAVRPLCASILEDLSPAPKPAAKPFKQTKAPTQVVPIGPKGGVGILFGWRIPSFFVWLIKGRTYFIEKSVGTVKGAAYVKA